MANGDGAEESADGKDLAGADAERVDTSSAQGADAEDADTEGASAELSYGEAIQAELPGTSNDARDVAAGGAPAAEAPRGNKRGPVARRQGGSADRVSVGAEPAEGE